MTPSLAAFTFINVWCVSLFVMLPLKRKFAWRRWQFVAWNTFTAAAITLLIHVVVTSGIIPVR